MAHEAPEVAVASISETVIEGEKAEFRCEASGIPSPIITWERLGFNLPKGALDRNGLLIIPSAGPEDAGTYICKAVNSEGDDSAKVQLEVIGKSLLIQIFPRTVLFNQSINHFYFLNIHFTIGLARG